MPIRRRQLDTDKFQWGILIVAKGEKRLSPNSGVKTLAAALPYCRIEWDGGVIEPAKAGKK
jgi:hypothetical protein